MIHFVLYRKNVHGCLNDNTTGVFRKALIDGSPDVPSGVIQGFYSNVYNATLSATKTTTSAGLSSLVVTAIRPLSTMVGAKLLGDDVTFRRAMFEYSSLSDTLQKSFKQLSQIYKRSADDPFVMTGREDSGVIGDNQLKILRKTAAAAAENGEYGLQAMEAIISEQNALAMSPWSRIGPRLLQSLDGFTRAFTANIEARGRAWEQVTNGGKIPLDAKKSEELSQKIYESFYDKNGNMTDEAVK